MNQLTLTSTVRNRENEWAVILAGGDGTRLKSLTRKIAGDERPKQFCSVLGQKPFSKRHELVPPLNWRDSEPSMLSIALMNRTIARF
jgi:hypothetical protein